MPENGIKKKFNSAGQMMKSEKQSITIKKMRALVLLQKDLKRKRDGRSS